MWRLPKRSFLNKFGVWADTTWTAVEQKAAEKGVRFRAYNLFSNVGILKNQAFLNKLAEKLDSKSEPLGVECTRITENSLLLFHSENAGRYLPLFRMWEMVLPPYVLFLSHTWLPTIAFGLLMWLHQPLVIGASRTMVTRMDLIPSQEAILFHKVGAFGKTYTELVPIKNLGRIKAIHSQWQYYYRIMGGGVNLNMIFKNWESGEEYAFETHGVWNEENLKHKLIN